MTHDVNAAANSTRTTIKRLSERGAYDRGTINAIIDEATVCHVGIVDDGQPFVMPTIHVRIDDTLYLHGSLRSRLLRVVGAGEPVCITITLLDGLVLARSAFHHSMNYRSVVVLGRGRTVACDAEKLRALDALMEHVVPGRSVDARGPNDKEFAATQVVGVPISEASAKVRTGPPSDDEVDYELPVWAGVIPISLAPGAPVPDPRMRRGIATPAYVSEYARPRQL